VTVPSLAILLHVVVAVVFVAGLIGRFVVLGAAARSTDLQSVKALVATSGPFERMVTVGSILVLVLGIAAAVVLGRPLLGPLQGGRLDWLFVALVLYLTIVPLVPLVFLPRGRAFEAALAEAEAAGEVTPQLQAAFADPRVRAARAYEAIAVTLVLVLMVLKPF
jgi:hypothetical protein